MAGEEDVDFLTLTSQLSQKGRLGEATSSTHESSEDAKKELEVLWRRVKTTASLLTYLKSKARIMTNPHLSLTSCGIRHSNKECFVNKNHTPMSNWSKNIDFSNLDHPEVETWIKINNPDGVFDEQDEVYVNEVLKSVQMITYVMESLEKRVLMAESEAASEKQKVSLGQEEIKKKEIQIETMYEKLEEMDRFAVDTNCILNEMRKWVDDLVEETTTQRQRATENEEELIRVKREFESLKTYVNSLISVRETLVSSEKQFQSIEKLFDRLVVKTTQLETEKTQKEAEIQKLMDENMKLNALVDKKEAQLLAMNEQCKVMALSASNI